MPLLTTLQMSAEVNPAGEAISSFCNNVQPLRLKKLNCRQVARAQWLSVPHDTRLTSRDAPNQEAEICHLGAVEIAGVPSGGDEAFPSGVWIPDASLFSSDPPSHPPHLLIG